SSLQLSYRNHGSRRGRGRDNHRLSLHGSPGPVADGSAGAAMNTLAVLPGLAFGLGVVLVSAWLRARKPTLAARIAPYVRATDPSESMNATATLTPFPTLERLLAPVLRDGVRAVEKWGSPTSELKARLERAGSGTSVEQF